MQSSKAKCKVLHMGNPKHTYRLGREWLKSSPEEKDFTVLVVRHWNRLSSEAVNTLKEFKARLDGASSNLSRGRYPCL